MNSVLHDDIVRGRVCAGGVLYDDTAEALRDAAAEWRECARSVIAASQPDTDWAYRLMGARAARYRLKVSRALLRRAESNDVQHGGCASRRGPRPG